jgi:hypothetical protein
MAAPLKPSRAEIANAFVYHPPFGSQVERYQVIRDEFRSLALVIEEMAPDSREKSTAIAKLREACMWANAAIACNESPPAA